MDRKLEKLYASSGRQSIALERLIRGLLLQVLYTIRSQRLLVEQLEYSPLFHWFVWLSVDEPVWTTPRSARTGIACWNPTSPGS